MKFTFDTESNDIVGPYVGEVDKSTSRLPLPTYIDKYSDFYVFKTGIMPVTGSGILSIQRALGFEQIIYQLEPSVNLVKWGYYESDHNAKLYNLAMPWHIVIADFKQNNFVGARHFYSPDPIFDWSQPLYATNLPNTNTTGYRGNSLGWVCLYHTTDTRSMTFNERLHYAISRIHGVAEPYNDANMSETDGPRFYAHHGAEKFMTDPTTWQAKTKKEGVDWIVNRDLLIPLYSHSLDVNDHHQKYVNPKKDSSAIPYTLDIAANHPYSAYYHDHDYTKPFMIALDEVPTVWLSSIFTGDVSAAKVPAKKAAPAAAPTPKEIAAAVKKASVKKTPKMTALAKGAQLWSCPRCKKQWNDVSEAVVTSVWTALDASPADEQVNWENSCKEDWCQNCVDDANYIGLFDLYVDPEISVWSSYWEEYFLISAYSECGNCGEAHPWNADNKEVWVYDNPHTQDPHAYAGCVACISEDEFIKDTLTHKWVLTGSDYIMLVSEKILGKIGNEFMWVDKLPYYTSGINQGPVCPTFYQISTSIADQAASPCENCAGGCHVILNGTPESLNIPSLI